MKTSFLKSGKVENMEEFISSLILGMHQLNTMMSFQAEGAETGLLSPIEQEMLETCMWEIKRLMILYHKLTEKVLEKTDFTQKQLNECLEKIAQISIKRNAKNSNRKVKIAAPSYDD